MSSNKLSQSEIDNLIASLLTGEASSGQPAGAQGADPSGPPPSADATVPPTGEVSFNAVVDLGPISQAEVDSAIQTYEQAKVSPSAAAVLAVAESQPGATPSELVAAAPAPPADLEDPSSILAQALATVSEPAQAVSPSPTSPTPVSATPVAAPLAMSPKAAPPRRAMPALPASVLQGVLLDVELNVTVELGRARLSLGDILALGPGSVIPLEKLANTPVDVKVNGLRVMKAEVLAIGEKYGVRITESSMKTKIAS